MNKNLIILVFTLALTTKVLPNNKPKKIFVYSPKLLKQQAQIEYKRAVELYEKADTEQKKKEYKYMMKFWGGVTKLGLTPETTAILFKKGKK